MDRIPDGIGRTEISEELPQGMERRLVLRLLAYWRMLRDERDDRDYPSFCEVDPFAIPEIWPHCFVVGNIEDGSEPVFCVVGDELAGYVSESLVDQPISAVPETTLPGVAVSFLDEVLEKGVPISRGDAFFKDDGTKVLYRSILLPMSDDGDTISGFLGAANCREVREDE